MTSRHEVHKTQQSSEVPNAEIQALLQQQKRERLKAAAKLLATSTPEEQAAFLENIERRPWSTQE